MPTALAARLPPVIAAYATPQLRLGAELDRLAAVHGVGAGEAAVFYCARITEHLVGASVEAMKLPRSRSLFSNLEALHRYNAIERANLHWAHAIRRMGNAVRHAARPIDASDVSASLAFLETTLEWFFTRSAAGPQLESAGLERTVAHDAQAHAMAGLLRGLERLEPAQVVERASRPDLGANATIAAAVAEDLIDRAALDVVEPFLDAALERHPDQSRLIVLRALLASRSGRLDEAVVRLAAIDVEGAGPEAAGVLGGILKRAAAANDDRALLVRAHASYRRGWRRSGQASAYLGINCATTALLLDDAARAEQVAQVVEEQLAARHQALARDGVELGFWDRLTSAEAALVTGRSDHAYQLYEAVFAAYPERAGALASARTQAVAIASHLGAPTGRFEDLGRT